jgi:hypothetical protein
MSVAESQAKLSRAARDLFVRWDQTASSWRDENRRQFEKKYLVLLRLELNKTKRAMEHIDTVLNHIRHDCG